MSRKLFIVSSYFNQEERMSVTAVFNSYMDARRYIRHISINHTEIDKKYPNIPKYVIKKIIEKEVTGKVAFPIIDFRWISENLSPIIKTYRISILFLN